MKTFSLKTVLICPYVALVLGLALAIGFLSYSAGSKAVNTVSEHLLHETVSRISQAVDRHVVGSVATLKTAFPEGMLAPDNIEDDFSNILTRLWIATSLHTDPNNYVYYGNLKGQAIGLYRLAEDAGELRIKYRVGEHRQRFLIKGSEGSPNSSQLKKSYLIPVPAPGLSLREHQRRISGPRSTSILVPRTWLLHVLVA